MIRVNLLRFTGRARGMLSWRKDPNRMATLIMDSRGAAVSISDLAFFTLNRDEARRRREALMELARMTVDPCYYRGARHWTDDW